MLSRGVSGRLVSRNYTTESTLSRMIRLVGLYSPSCNCTSTTSNCNSGKALPSRVLDLQHDMGGSLVRVVENHDRCGHFAALSHCWGDTRFVTTAQNLPDRLEGIQISAMPQTFQDAILVTRRLGLRYLWIDSLCILQADPAGSEAGNQAAKMDFETESSMMNEYYGKSYITIAADCSPSDSDGFLGCKRAKKGKTYYEGEAEEFQCEVDGIISNLYLHRHLVPEILVGQEKGDPVATECLQTRAWTLQERLLPNRVLHFGSEQCYLEDHMRGYIQFEDGSMSNYSRSWQTLYKEGFKSPLEEWYAAIEQFKSRKITNPSDTFPALSGLAQRIAKLSGDQYCAGLWNTDLARGILWETEKTDYVPGLLLVRGDPTPSCTAPSWSWASAPGSVRFIASGALDNWSKVVICATFEECQTVPSTSDPFGELRNGYINLTAPTLAVQNTAWIHPYRSLRLSIRGYPASVHALLDHYYRPLNLYDVQAIPKPLYCAFILCSPEYGIDFDSGVILEEVSYENDRCVYRRVGVFKVERDREHRPRPGFSGLELEKRLGLLNAYQKAIQII